MITSFSSWTFFVLLNAYYGGALTMFFTSEVKIWSFQFQHNKTEEAFSHIGCAINEIFHNFLTFWCLTTALLLPDYLLTNVQLPDHCLMTDWQLTDVQLTSNCLTTAWRLPDDCLKTAWRLPDNCMKTAWQLWDECLITDHQKLPSWLGSKFC